MTRKKVSIIAATLIAGAMSTPAYAACDLRNTSELEKEGGTPTEIVNKIVDDAEPSDKPDAPTYAGDGPAEPRENWFGCGPDSDGTAECELSDEAKEQSKQAASRTDANSASASDKPMATGKMLEMAESTDCEVKSEG